MTEGYIDWVDVAYRASEEVRFVRTSTQEELAWWLAHKVWLSDLLKDLGDELIERGGEDGIP
jgi:hypothetical protein